MPEPQPTVFVLINCFRPGEFLGDETASRLNCERRAFTGKLFQSEDGLIEGGHMQRFAFDAICHVVGRLDLFPVFLGELHPVTRKQNRVDLARYVVKFKAEPFFHWPRYVACVAFVGVVH